MARITEVETIVVRPSDAGIPFVTADIKPLPVWNEILPAALRIAATEDDRPPRMAISTRCSSTTARCTRSSPTTATAARTACSRPTTCRTVLDPLWKSGCADQFRLGQYRYDDRLRDRRFLAVDEERGIVLAGGFIDHEGRLGDFKLTDGTTRSSIFRRPHSFVLLEAFKITGGQDPADRGGVHHRALQHAVALDPLGPGAGCSFARIIISR